MTAVTPRNSTRATVKAVILAALAAAEPRPQTAAQIAVLVPRTANYIARLLDELHADGLVARAVDPTDPHKRRSIWKVLR